MIETRTATHPLFDPTSLLGQMCVKLSPEGKMRGYLSATWGRMRSEGIPPAVPHRPDILAALARLLAGRAPAGGAAPGHETVLNGDGETMDPDLPPVLDAWLIDKAAVVEASGEGGPWDAAGALCLVRHGAGHALTGAFFGAPCLHPCRCRAFLFEPEVVARIQDAVGERPWLDVFRAEVLADNFKASQALAAAPEMGGRAGPGGILLGPVPGPDRYATLPPRPGPLHVVIVLDTPG